MTEHSLESLTLAVHQHRINLADFEDALNSWRLQLSHAKSSGVLVQTLRDECEQDIIKAELLLELVHASKQYP